MNKILLLTIITLSFTMCNSDVKKTYYDNGNIKKECHRIEGQKIECTEYYLSGAKKFIAHMQEGKQHGKTTVYYENGSIEREVFFKNGIQQDSMTIYYSNGNIMEKSTIENGVKNGTFIHYREDGSIQTKTNLKDGLIDGICTYLKKNGEIANTIEFKNGEPINWISIKKGASPFSISYPDNWDTTTSKKTNTLLTAFHKDATSAYKANINIIPLTVNNTESTEKVIEMGITELKQTYPSFKLIQKDNQTMHYEISQENDKVRSINKVLLCEGKYLLLIASSTSENFEHYEPIFDLITASFKN